MLISRSSLLAVLRTNVCEIRFLRRRPKLGRSPYRRMLCTNASNLLLSIDGRMTLNFTPAKGPPKFNHADKNVIVAWDVLMQDFRTINCINVDLIRSVPSNEEFWDYFRKELLPMTASQKTMFMDS